MVSEEAEQLSAGLWMANDRHSFSQVRVTIGVNGAPSLLNKLDCAFDPSDEIRATPTAMLKPDVRLWYKALVTRCHVLCVLSLYIDASALHWTILQGTFWGVQ